MNFLETLFIAVALSMDAFAVSVACGITSPKLPMKNAFIVALFFGGFQMFMPIIGWNLSELAYNQIQAYDHWVAFLMLAAVGGKMVWDAAGIGKKEEQIEKCQKCFANPLDYKMLFILAVATSLDALAVGVSFSCTKQPIFAPSSIIGVVTFLFSIAGLKFGTKIGDKFEGKFTFLGGIVLIGIGLKILITG